MLKQTILLFFCILALSTAAFAQTASEKAWPAFWKAFTNAVEKRNKPAIKRLMASEREFFSGGGGETRSEWLDMIENDGNWPLLVKTVRKGTKPLKGQGYKGPARITKDNILIFEYLHGRWRFVGPMGD